jgi:hypothetical protein
MWVGGVMQKPKLAPKPFKFLGAPSLAIDPCAHIPNYLR